MELDDLKSAWQTLNRRLDAQTALNLHIFKDGKLDKARRGLRPLFWGQLLQILCGIALVLLTVSFWTTYRGVAHLLFAGLSLHVYGVLMIIFGGVTISLIGRIDYAAPVLAIQKQLGQLHRFYVHTSLGLGLAWWLLWIPLTMMFFIGVFGADMYANVPEVIWINIAVGFAGLLATWWFHRWSRDPSRPRLAKFMRDSVTGSSLRKAQAMLDEIARFEQG